MIQIYFDLDGTLYDLYGLPDWLEKLRNEQAGAYTDGEPLFDENSFYNIISDLLLEGVKFGVITWLAMQASEEYEASTTEEKRNWCKKFLPFIETFAAQSYGTPKQKAIGKHSAIEILIDDNPDVCRVWETKKQRIAYCVNEKYTVCDALTDIYHKYFEGAV